MDTNNNVQDIININGEEVIASEEKKATFGTKAKTYFKNNGKKIVKKTIIGVGLLTAGFALGVRSGLIDKIDVSDLDVDVTEL